MIRISFHAFDLNSSVRSAHFLFRALVSRLICPVLEKVAWSDVYFRLELGGEKTRLGIRNIRRRVPSPPMTEGKLLTSMDTWILLQSTKVLSSYNVRIRSQDELVKAHFKLEMRTVDCHFLDWNLDLSWVEMSYFSLQLLKNNNGTDVGMIACQKCQSQANHAEWFNFLEKKTIDLGIPG